MNIIPLTLRAANDFVEEHHRHSARTNNDGGKFAIGLEHDGVLVGVAIVGRPVARMLARDELTAEVVRCCVSPDAPKGAPSKLYQQCARIWQLMGGKRVATYVLKREGGASMRNLEGGGWSVERDVKSEQWDRPNRPRRQRPIYEDPKTRFDRLL